MTQHRMTLTGKLDQDPKTLKTARGRTYLRARMLDQELVIWDPNKTPGASTLSRGAQIRVTGRRQTFRFTQDDTTQTVERFIVEDLEVLTVTLTGFLGKDPQYRATEEKTIEVTRKNPIAEMDETLECIRTSRTYLRLSLATHPQGFQGPTTWHQLLVWDGDAAGTRTARLVGKGDKVRVIGRPTTYTFTGDDNVERTIERIVVEDLQVVSLKARKSA